LTGTESITLMRDEAEAIIFACDAAFGEGLLPIGAGMVVVRISRVWPDIVPDYLLKACTE